MYLLTLTILIVAVLGIYVQVLGLQTARFYAKQTSVAEAMIQWHRTAVGDAHYANISYTAAGCSLTNSDSTACTDPASDKIYVQRFDDSDTGSTPPLCSTNNYASTCAVMLPKGYSKNYAFNSIAYYSSSDKNHYVMTYIMPPTTVPPFIQLANGKYLTTGKQLALTTTDLLMQLKHSGLVSMAYGAVQGGTLTAYTTTYVPTSGLTTYKVTPYTYPLPPAPTGHSSWPDGTVAIISTP